MRRYELCVVHNGKHVSLKTPDRSRGGSTRTVLKDLSAHPEDSDPIRVLDGRYGPNVNAKRTNATVTKKEVVRFSVAVSGEEEYGLVATTR